MIYFDNAADTPLTACMVAEYSDDLKNYGGNSASINKSGIQASEIVEQSRNGIAEIYGAKPREVIFTSGGCEGNSLALFGIAQYLWDKCKLKILVSDYEHSSVINAANELERNGFLVEYIPIDKSTGQINYEWLESELCKGGIGLVSVMYVQNEIGTINDVKRIAKMCHNYGALYHCDCVQAVWENIEFNKFDFDFATISGHKLNAPKNTGCLLVKEELRKYMRPIIFGGKQEGGLRGGTLDAVAINNFHFGATYHHKNKRAVKYLTELKAHFLNYLYSMNKDIEITPYDFCVSCGYIVALTVKGIKASLLVPILSEYGLEVSGGSACEEEEEPSRTYLAIGMSKDDALCTIRISFGAQNNIAEVIKAADILECVIKQLRGLK